VDHINVDVSIKIRRMLWQYYNSNNDINQLPPVEPINPENNSALV